MSESLFGHLAVRFAPKPENLATEAVCYILERYPSAASAFMRFLQNMGLKLCGPITFRTQCVGSEDSIPDLVGTDSEGNRRIIAESKFWAGLTDNQPVTYLSQLPSDSEGVLLFIAPRMRFPTIWPELLTRCKEASLSLGAETVEAGEMKYRKVGICHLLALASWRSILAVLLESLEAEGNQAGSADVRQVQGLCERMDSEAFLPISSEELSPLIAKRTVQYCQLVNEVSDVLAKEGVGVWKSVGGTITTASYGRYVIVEDHGCFLQFNPDLWSRKRCTPMWFNIRDKDWKPVSGRTMAALAPLECEDPPRVIKDGPDALVPLLIPLGVEQDAVVSSLVRQIRQVAALLSKAGSEAKTFATESGTQNA